MMKMLFVITVMIMNLTLFSNESFLMNLYIVWILLVMSFSNNLYKMHPMMLNLMVLLMMLMTTGYTSFYKNTPWFSFMIFLIIISGLMVLFMYLMNFSINEYSVLNKKWMFKMTLKTNMLIIMLIINTKVNLINLNLLNSMMMEFINNHQNTDSINYLSTKIISGQPLLLMIYLLVFLMVISFICKTKKSCIRQMKS
uniref:NADH dehydrogenase subunit 6 n=1 Tax=Platygaster robiniae TaxID=2753657 RepID=UPI002113BC69|nr:NADH dehydrogenase subunit 6 [Platygaster robiniae]UTI38874.1 NADH dehydrogenase subunit 6 [Platygaster robiniae]